MQNQVLLLRYHARSLARFMTWSRIRRLLAIVGCLTFVGFAIASWCVGGALVAPANHSVGAPPTDWPVVVTTISSESGSNIATWYVRNQDAHATIVLLHPIRCDRRQKVVVLGRLNVPLRTMIRFRAKWIESTDKSKPEAIPLRLQILNIDGKHVDRKILFLPYDVEVVDSTNREIKPDLHREFDLYGYEDWVTSGPPIEFQKAVGNIAAWPTRGKTQIKAIVDAR